MPHAGWPRAAAARAPVSTAGHCWPVTQQETLKHSEINTVYGLALPKEEYSICLLWHLFLSLKKTSPLFRRIPFCYAGSYSSFFFFFLQSWVLNVKTSAPHMKVKQCVPIPDQTPGQKMMQITGSLALLKRKSIFPCIYLFSHHMKKE